ncbi:MAG: sigma-70 family RNA polymerase sigma factor [Planctomycetaceae bacterium]
MPSPPETHPGLILRLSNPQDDAAWEEFVVLYRPVIIRLAIVRGLQPVDAEDVAQQVLMSVARSVPDWQHDPARGQFRTWLHRVVRNAVTNVLSRQVPDRAAGGTSALMLINRRPADDSTDEEVLLLEWRREAFRWAVDRVRDEFRPATWEAFWLTAVDGVSAAEVARKTGRTVGAVYVARCRVMSRIQEKVRQLSGADFVKGRS